MCMQKTEKMQNYYIITGKFEGETDELFGSFNKQDCIYELEGSKETWKGEGYKSIKIEIKKVDSKPNKEVYPEFEASNLIG